MRYTDLINKIAINAHLPAAQVKKFLDAYNLAVLTALRTGDVVTHTNLGTWYLGKRTARMGRNPRTQQPLFMPARKVVHLRVAKNANEFVN